MQESSKKNVLRVISAQDSIEDTEVSFNILICAEKVAVCGSVVAGTHGIPTACYGLTRYRHYQVDEDVTKIM